MKLTAKLNTIDRLFDAVKKLETAEAELARLRAECEGLEADRDRAAAVKVTLCKSRDEARAEVTHLTAECAAKDKTLNERDAEIARIGGDVLQARSELQLLIEHHREVQQSRNGWRIIAERLRNEHRDERGKLVACLDGANHEINTARARIAEMERETAEAVAGREAAVKETIEACAKAAPASESGTNAEPDDIQAGGPACTPAEVDALARQSAVLNAHRADKAEVELADLKRECAAAVEQAKEKDAEIKEWQDIANRRGGAIYGLENENTNLLQLYKEALAGKEAHMGGLSTNQRVMLVKQERGGGFDIETYDTPYEAVFHLLNSGSIGDGSHGSDAHVQALEMLKRKVERTLAEIKERALTGNDEDTE